MASTGPRGPVDISYYKGKKFRLGCFSRGEVELTCPGPASQCHVSTSMPDSMRELTMSSRHCASRKLGIRPRASVYWWILPGLTGSTERRKVNSFS